jgi:putative cell wall-binding protein
VVIATGKGDDKFADALAGTPIAYVLDAPMLFTTTDGLDAGTHDEIIRLNAKFDMKKWTDKLGGC